MNDGYLQHMRVGADSGIGAKYIAREDAESGRHDRFGRHGAHPYRIFSAGAEYQENSSLQSDEKRTVRNTPKKWANDFGIETIPVGQFAGTFKKARISLPVARIRQCRSSSANGWKRALTLPLSAASRTQTRLQRIDVSLRLGNAPAPWGLPEMGLADEYITYAAVPNENAGFQMKRAGKRAHGAIAEDRCVLLGGTIERQEKGADFR